MNPYMTEAEAWREIARRIASGNMALGICFMFDALQAEGAISMDTWDSMANRIADAKCEKHAIGDGWCAYLWTPGECADEREMYCLFMALLAEDDQG